MSELGLVLHFEICFSKLLVRALSLLFLSRSELLSSIFHA